MYLVWSTPVSFLFDSWTADTESQLALGSSLCFVVAFLSTSFGFIRKQLFTQSRRDRTLVFLLNYVLKLLIMFLIMSMSGWACLAVVLGMAAGQVVFEGWFKGRQGVGKEKDQSNVSIYTDLPDTP